MLLQKVMFICSCGGLARRTEAALSQTDAGGWVVGHLHGQNFVNVSPHKKPALFFKQAFFPFTAQHITSQKPVSPGRAVHDFMTSFYYINFCDIQSV